jgi:two-component system response regulator NreC
MMSIRILLADDHELIREGIYSLLEKEKDFKIVAQANNGREAVRLTDEHHPDIAVLDVHMPDLNGIEATKQIRKKNPDTRIIALSMYSSRRFVDGMLKAGASGYLVKNCAYEELTHAIRIVDNDQSYLSPQIQKVLIDDYVTNISDEKSDLLSILTSREMEVLQLIAEGVSSEGIASRLYVSVKTISTHRQHIFKKLDLNSIADLTRFAIREGVISLDA